MKIRSAAQPIAAWLPTGQNGWEKTTLTAYQASSRGGLLKLQLQGDRVLLAGQAVTVWKGECYC